MAFEFHLPDLAEGMAEAEVVAWKVKVGDQVKLDQPLVEVMSDKATVEIPSPRAGRMAKILFQEGQICPVGGILFVIDEDAKMAAAPVRGATAATAAPTTAPARPTATPPTRPTIAAEVPGAARAEPPAGNGHPLDRAAAPRARPATRPPDWSPELPPESAPMARPAAARLPEITDASSERARVLATPATRKLARSLGVELGVVPPSGNHGRVTTEDVKRFATDGASRGLAVVASPAAPAPERPRHQDALEERIPLRGLRKRIAENMARATHTAAHFTYVEDVDTTELVALRARVRDKAAARGIKLSYLPFFMKAVVAGLKKWPALNASLDEATQEIVRKRYYHLGIAAQGPQGLVVTVVRDADRRSILELATEVQRLADAVQSGTASRDDLIGSTFTISSLGKLGGVLATPIINFPEVGILGIHKMEERAVVREGNIVARWMLNLSISLDHRLVDGWDGAMFLQEVKALLEDPTLLFMEMV